MCCASLEEPKTLMKMGLSMVLIGHMNFLLGALVHGVVLRHINFHKQARAMEYAISNVVALTSGLVGIVVGILAILLSKNKQSKGLTWSLLTVGVVASLTAAASAIGLLVSMVRAILHDGRSLLTHCRFPDTIGYSSITTSVLLTPRASTRTVRPAQTQQLHTHICNTGILSRPSTTLILWVPLIVTCVIQMVFSARCSAVCVSFLGLPCCPNRKRKRDFGRSINVVRPIEEAAPPRYAEAPRNYTEPPRSYTEPPRSYTEPQRSYTEPPRSYTESTRSYDEPPRSHAESQRSSAESPRSYAESSRSCPIPQRSYAEYSRSCPEPQRSYAESSRSCPEPQRSYAEYSRSCPEPQRSYAESPRSYAESPRSYAESTRSCPEPQRQQLRPPPLPHHLPKHHQCLPPSERRPLRSQHKKRSDRERQETRAGSEQNPPEQHQLLERGTMERSSFWV
ncbi:Transmembrane protein 54 [Dissostichus eleginoides]|uniref:Transmembrane protein 54 n=1 Tax=Dissostichus eleginoides TaxID=100907 RepID=A0AAD9BBU2_DISEL|nr:Transmembrane protein 54 [Dissostichus eleginoides]